MGMVVLSKTEFYGEVSNHLHEEASGLDQIRPDEPFEYFQTLPDCFGFCWCESIDQASGA